MRSLRRLAPFAVALGLIVAAPAAGGSGQNAGPPAEAAGAEAPLPIPSIVNTRIVRAQAALARAAKYTDANQVAQAITALNTASANAVYAWNAAKYVIKATPPPADDAFPDGDAAHGGYAGPEDTAFAALSVQHDVVDTTVGLLTQVGAKNVALRKSWVNAIAKSQAARNAAVAYIHTLAPTPVEDGVGADGPDAGALWPTVMPGLVPLANDEIKELNGRMKMTGFTGTLRKSLLASRTRAVKTRTLVNKYWPPVPAD
jgi:hypothetical protein